MKDNNNTEHRNRTFGPQNRAFSWLDWEDWTQGTLFDTYEKTVEAYDFLIDYSKVFNVYPARVAQPNPFSNKVMYLIDTLNSLEVKYSVDVFGFDGRKINWGLDEGDHKLVNIIVEPNPQATGPAIVFCAHHDVYNTRSENCQDNGASVCNLLRLANLIKQSEHPHQRVIILLSDCEENGAKGAKRFAKQSKKISGSTNIQHNIYGEISGVVNLELTGLGTSVWSDCGNNKADSILHKKLEDSQDKPIVKLRTPPSDVIAFREFDYPAICIGILPEDEIDTKETWRLCHSMEDTLNKCNRKDMEEFTLFLLKLTKTNYKTEHDNSTLTTKTTGAL